MRREALISVMATRALQVHMLLLAYMARDIDIPPALKPDLTFVLTKAPLLLEEMFKIASLPRPPMGYGWLVRARTRTAWIVAVRRIQWSIQHWLSCCCWSWVKRHRVSLDVVLPDPTPWPDFVPLQAQLLQ
jgi:hypothetical protein